MNDKLAGVLVARFGEYRQSIELDDGAIARGFVVNEDGDSVALVRTATPDVESALAQIQRLEDADEGGRVRLLVVALGVSGIRGLDMRPDLMMIGDAIAEGWCRRVACVDYSRVSRNVGVGIAFGEYLRQHEVELVLPGLSEAGGSDSSSAPFDQLTLALAGLHDRRRLAQRMAAGRRLNANKQI